MIVVRPVAPDDYDAVARLMVEVYADVMGGTLSDGYRAHLSDVARRAEHALVFVAVDLADDGDGSGAPDRREAGAGAVAGVSAGRGAVVGSVTYVRGPEGPYAEFDAPDEGGIRMLVVAPEVQRRGVGARLVQACLDQARADGRRRVSLHTTAPMVAAQRLYERLGFRRAPERDWAPESGVHLLGYILELG